MENPNPYESPKAPIPDKVCDDDDDVAAAPVYHGRIQAVRGEMWREARSGFKASLAGWWTCLALVLLALVVMLFDSPVHARFDQLFVELLSRKDARSLCLVILGIPVVMTIYCVVPGSLIAGVRAAISWRPRLVQNVTADTSSKGNS